jgi:hypothetical protein
VGSSARSNVLEDRLEVLFLLVSGLADTLEAQLVTLAFIKPDFRLIYAEKFND